MKYGKLVAITLALCLLLPGMAARAAARQVEPVVLPPGTIQLVYTAAEANALLIAQGRNTPSTKSWDETGSVSQVKTAQVEHYVRVYAYDDSRLKGGAVGSWMMRASSLRGMTAQQIKDVFALPSTPTYITCVRVPLGTTLWTGAAGTISGWGDGGAQQMMLVDRIDLSTYTYQRELGVNALWYGPQVVNNPNHVGFYLDHLARASPYSDLEYVYNMLDYLAPASLSSALEQIGPSRYDALNRLALAETVGVHQTILTRARSQLTEEADRRQPGPNLWVRLLGSSGRQSESDGLAGWRYKTTALLTGLDYANSRSQLLGLAVGLTYSDLSFDNSLGEAKRTTPLIGLYYGWAPRPWDVNLALTGGPTSATMKRNLIFSELSRTATGQPDGYLLGLGINAGYSLPLGQWTLRPMAGLDLLRYHQQSLAETGADALNLNLDDYSASTARAALGAAFSRAYALAGGLTLSPSAGLAWTYTSALDSRSLASSLSGQPGSFITEGDTRARHGLNPTLALTLAASPTLSFTLAYSGEIREDLLAHTLDLGVIWRF